MSDFNAVRVLDETINNTIQATEGISRAYSDAGEGIGGLFIYFIIMLLLVIMGAALIGGIHYIFKKQ